MIQLPNKCSMFAAFFAKGQTFETNKRWAFFMPYKDVVSKKYKAVKSHTWHPSLVVECCSLARNGRRQPFLYPYISNSDTFMPKNNGICNAANNSNCTATSAHETCILSSLSGNPFRDLALYGLDLNGCKINFLRKENENGHSVTGVFNISGCYHTAAANSYAELIASIVHIRMDRKRYVYACQKAKRERYKMNRMKRLSAEA